MAVKDNIKRTKQQYKSNKVKKKEKKVLTKGEECSKIIKSPDERGQDKKTKFKKIF